MARPRRKLRWVKFDIDNLLFGTTREELDVAERSIWYDLILLAGQANDDGWIIPPVGALPRILNAPEEVVTRAIEKCVEYGKVELGSDRLRLVNYTEYNPPGGERQGREAEARGIGKAFEDEIFELLSSGDLQVNGGSAKQIERQFRIEGRYIDFVMRDKDNRLIIIEIKNFNASTPAVKQIINYIEMLKQRNPEDDVQGAIIAAGIRPALDYELADEWGLTLVEWENGLKVVQSGNVKLREVARSNKTSPHPREEERRIREESEESQIRSDAPADCVSTPADWTIALREYEVAFGLINGELEQERWRQLWADFASIHLHRDAIKEMKARADHPNLRYFGKVLQTIMDRDYERED